MTLHTRAATDDILDLFNQPLRNLGRGISSADAESGAESDYDEDEYTSAGESTGTGRISGATSEFGDDDGLTEARSVRSVGGAGEETEGLVGPHGASSRGVSMCLRWTRISRGMSLWTN